MRKKIYDIIGNVSDSRISKGYHGFMVFVIVVSLLSLVFKNPHQFFITFDKFALVIFIIDYLLRWIIADFHSDKKGILPFLLYPITPMAIIDLLSIIPFISTFNNSLKVFRLTRVIRLLRVFRFFRLFRYSKSIMRIEKVFRKQKDALITVFILSASYIFTSALIMFSIEPQSFNSFFDAIYWATISLTTVGYGDIYATSTLGKIVTMISAVLGVAIVALPTGIISAGYIKELEDEKGNV